MKIKTSTTVEKLEKGGDNVTATLKAKDGKTETLTVDRVILAVGIVGNVENVGLEAAGIKTDRTHVVINQWGETGVPGVWAIGDLVGAPWLAHKAMHEGVIVAKRIAGVKGVHPLDISKVPGCTYCWPQIASVGMTEAKARASGRKIKVGRFPFIGNGKAIALGESDGLIKTVFDADTGELLGAHMIGTEVTELIHGYTIARTLEATEAELGSTIFPHPTLSEMLHEAVLDADKKALHI
jgi:dihydrolipoamide dehydrogenase